MPLGATAFGGVGEDGDQGGGGGLGGIVLELAKWLGTHDNTPSSYGGWFGQRNGVAVIQINH